MSMSRVRGPQRSRRSRPPARSSSRQSASSSAGASEVSTSAAMLRNSGWSVLPQGAVRYTEESRPSVTAEWPRRLRRAEAKAVTGSPRLPPKARAASVLTPEIQLDSDRAERRRDRRAGLAQRDLDPAHRREALEDGKGHGARRRLEQIVAPRRERLDGDGDDVAVVDGVGELVADRGGADVDGQQDVEHEALAQALLLREEAVIGVDIELLDQDGASFAHGTTFMLS